MLSAFAQGSLFGERHGDGPLEVLALHGWGRSHRDFQQVLSPPGGAPLPSIALDLPGFGATPPPPGPMTSMDYAHAVAPVLDEADGPVVIVGHSHGGRVGLCLATIAPERVGALVLVGAPVLRRASATAPSWRYRALRGAHRMGLISDARMEAARRSHGSADYRAAEGVMRETLVIVVNETFDDELARLHCPTSLLWGANDTAVPVEVAERAAQLIGTHLAGDERPSVHLEVLEGVGHLVPTEAPAAVTGAILEVVG